jgi:copper chaperone
MLEIYSAVAPDIECGGCAASIRNALGRVKGVQKVDVDVDRKVVQVEYDPSAVDAVTLSDRLTKAGFPPGQS